MGALFAFEQADNDEEARSFINWLSEHDLLPKPDFKPGRTPTYAELRQALDETEGYKIEYQVNQKEWEVSIEAPNGNVVFLHNVNFDGHWTENEDVPSNVYWKNDDEVMLPIAQKLANICGTITISNDSDPFDLIFVFPESSE